MLEKWCMLNVNLILLVVFQYTEAFEVGAEVKDAFDINGYIILR